MKGGIYQMMGGSNTEFYPSGEITRNLLKEIMPNKQMTLLDPCAGDCGLTIKDRPYIYYNFDLEPRSCNVDKADFLKDKLFDEPKQIDAVIMNPPFGLLEEFVEKAFEYSPHLYLIGPYKTVLRKYAKHIKQCRSTVKLFNDFPVYTSIGVFELDKNYTGGKASSFKPPKATYNLDQLAVYTDHHIQNKPFVCIRITKARICRNEDLVKDSDLHEANEDIFKAEAATAGVAKGGKVSRSIVYLDSMEECKEFKKWYDDMQESFLREYLYAYCNNIPNLREIPAPRGFSKNIANFNTL